MYGFFRCTKRFAARGEDRILFEDVTLTFGQRERVAVLAPPGSGKSSLLRMLGGLERPTSGTVRPPEGLSWPVGFAGAFHPVLSGEENVRALAGILDADPDRVSAFTALFSELGDNYRRPLQEYSSGMRAQLAFAFSMATPRGFYIADETIGSGDETFRQKCERMMLRRLENAGLLFVTRSTRLAERFAERFAVLHERRIVECADMAEAKALFDQAKEQDDEFETVLAGLSVA